MVNKSGAYDELSQHAARGRAMTQSAGRGTHGAAGHGETEPFKAGWQSGGLRGHSAVSDRFLAAATSSTVERSVSDQL